MNVTTQPRCPLGWHATPTCNAWGHPSPFHGCNLRDAHPGHCLCRCDAKANFREQRGPRQRRTAA